LFFMMYISEIISTGVLVLISDHFFLQAIHFLVAGVAISL
jgi:hypothetical protein